MTTLELMQDLLTDSQASELLRQMILELIQSDSEIRHAIADVIINDVSFGISTDDFYDYYCSGYSISLSVNGSTVDSASISLPRSSS